MDFSEKIAELTKKVRNIGDTLGDRIRATAVQYDAAKKAKEGV